MTYHLKYRLVGADYEFIEVDVESETAVTLSSELDRVRERAGEIFATYDTLIRARDNGDRAAMDAAVDAMKPLGVTVLEESSGNRIPAQDEDVAPLWERPSVAETSSSELDDFDL